MAEPRHWHLVMYDVSDPKMLRRVHRLLRDWGQPVQYSVFRVRCTARQVAQLRFLLIKLVAPDDRLAFVRLCTGCMSRMSVRGRPIVIEESILPACWVV